MKYVLIFKPDAPMKIVGPFPSPKEAAAWGEAWDAENKLPFWQVIDHAVVEFIKP